MTRGAPRNGPRTNRTGTRKSASAQVYPALPAPSELELLRALCKRQGISPEDADLEAVRSFLDLILPALEELERRIPDDIVPTDTAPAS
jgi:hypothetical protein